MDNPKLVYTIAFEGPDLTMEGPREHHMGEHTSYESAEEALKILTRHSQKTSGRKNVRIQHRWVTDWEDSDG